MTARPPRVRGFAFAGVRCGVKTQGPDLALIASDRPATVAGVFTRSTVPGAPVLVSKRRVRDGRARVVVVNSGISNVGMGARGLADAEAMAERAGRCLGVPPGQVLVASTGVIGERLPIERIDAGIPRAVRALRADGISRAARAIMTTDTVPKALGRSFRVAGRRHAVAGIAKGSGMIEPKMATMLAYLVTDVAVEAPLLRGLWREVARETFNRVTVDGETSTSDMAVVFANGAGGGRPIRSARGAAAQGLGDALRHVATGLARSLARDGEGATKLVTVDVTGARTAGEAERAARRIANSLLVKTALFGSDPNWGRILQTLGAAEVRVDLSRIRIRLGGVLVYSRGASAGPDARARAGRRLQRPEVGIAVDLGVGTATARVWTCDLSTDYVRINAEYTT